MLAYAFTGTANSETGHACPLGSCLRSSSQYPGAGSHGCHRVLTTCACHLCTASSRECGRGQNERQSLHHSTLRHHHQTGQSHSHGWYRPPFLAKGTVSVHWWCRMLFTDRHLIFRDKVHGTGGPKLRDLWSKICVNIDHPSHPPQKKIMSKINLQ